MVVSRAQVLEIIRNKKAELDNFGIARIGIFGSAARDELSDSSDVDVLVEFAPSMVTLTNFMGTKFMLEDALGRKVDIATFDSVRKPRLKRAIERDIIYAA